MAMQTYLVGGAVRDELLGLSVSDRDYVVVGATPEVMLAKGYTAVGRDFPVFLHPQTHEEYALARTECKAGVGHQGFVFHTGDDVSLEADLQRRDLTINAIARDSDGNLIDPYNGKVDLEQRILRHVSPAFSEDPLRVLRVARFAARFAEYGFNVAEETMQLLREISASGELATLSAERIWQEMYKALQSRAPHVFIQTLRKAEALESILPEVDRLFGVPQPEKYHPEIDTGLHVCLALEQAVKHGCTPEVIYAVLLHDIGKGLTPESKWPAHHGHEKAGVKPIKRLGERLRVPKKFTQLAALTSEWHLHVHRALELTPKTLLKLFEKTDAFRRPERFRQLLQASEMDARGRTGLEERDYPQANWLEQLLEKLLAIDHAVFVGQGLSGQAIATALRKQRLDLITQHARNPV